MMRRSQFHLSSVSISLFLFAIYTISWNQTNAYPLIAEVEDTKCFHFNVPEDDDAHMLFVALPENVSDEVEEWFVARMNEMNSNTETFKNTMVNPPNEVKSKIDDKMSRQRSNLFLKIQKPGKPILRNQQFQWHRPVVMRNIVKMAARSKQGWDVPVGGYSICFENKGPKTARVVYDMVLLSEDLDEEIEEEQSKRVMKKEHLTPLEKNFNEGIMAAHKILNEMRYMQQREFELRESSESMNSRIRYFSYISVCVLIGVTFLQVTYLKSYFKKKKLM